MNGLTASIQGARVSSVLLKIGMALSGLVLSGWLTLHMLGNLLWFGGAQVMNGYGERLRDSGLLWPMRLALSAALGLHVLGAILTTQRARLARRTEYRVSSYKRATLASRSMRVTGSLLLLFLIYHVAVIYGVAHPAFIADDGYHNLTALLRHPVHALLYLLATALSAFHLRHGLGSAFITLGFVSEGRRTQVERATRVWALCVTAGFLGLVLAISLG
jgi:succinate dehydrogenase / fumarate reductase cytochrome b subunit